MAHGLRFTLPEKLYLKDPQDSKYGHRLLQNTVVLMAEIGFEAFTFKKLAIKMGSAETSIYRYFENKHFILLYLTCWYWEWVHYLIDINTNNIEDPKLKLQKAIYNIINASKESTLTEYVNENLLHHIIVTEGTKSYHIHDVDKENKEGLFVSYKELVEKLSSIMSEINPSFEYPRSLSSTLFEMANNQIYFAEHLPRLTDLNNKSDKLDQLESIMNKFALSVLAGE